MTLRASTSKHLLLILKRATPNLQWFLFAAHRAIGNLSPH